MTSKSVDRSCDLSQPVELLNSNEQFKARSNYLRGDIAEGLQDPLTGAVPGDDPLLMKFHGIYQQDDRDLRADRAQRKLEPNYQFMVRLRIPGGLLTAKQWLGLNEVAKNFAERGLRITTRQTIQLHGIRKRRLRAMMQAVRDLGLDTIAACGDDSRGVVCGANPALSTVHQQVADLARATSNRLIPKTGAYREIWYDDAPARNRAQLSDDHLRNAPQSNNFGESSENNVANDLEQNLESNPENNLESSEDPLYGPLYLPRKFKVGYVIPPVNDIDVYGQDLGLIAIVEQDQLVGFNVCVGGGMGQLDTRDDSYPRLAEQIGFIPADEAPAFAEMVMGIQRDYGDRQDRHRARFKYTLDRLGTPWFLDTLAERRGKSLASARPFTFTQNGDELGWQQGSDGLWHGTLYIESGRVDGALQSQLAAFFQQYGGQIRLTTNQNLQLTHIGDYELAQVQCRLDDLDLSHRLKLAEQAALTLSCVSLPTCGLAMAEAERYTPDFLFHFNRLKSIHGIQDVPITLRISGCPNGCARPYLAEIALTGRAPGLYNLYLGGSFHGDRLARLYASNANEEKIMELLDVLFARYTAQRQHQEYFGDFLVRNALLDSLPDSLPDHSLTPHH